MGATRRWFLAVAVLSFLPPGHAVASVPTEPVPVTLNVHVTGTDFFRGCFLTLFDVGQAVETNRGAFRVPSAEGPAETLDCDYNTSPVSYNHSLQAHGSQGWLSRNVTLASTQMDLRFYVVSNSDRRPPGLGFDVRLVGRTIGEERVLASGTAPPPVDPDPRPPPWAVDVVLDATAPALPADVRLGLQVVPFAADPRASGAPTTPDWEIHSSPEMPSMLRFDALPARWTNEAEVFETLTGDGSLFLRWQAESVFSVYDHDTTEAVLDIEGPDSFRNTSAPYRSRPADWFHHGLGAVNLTWRLSDGPLADGAYRWQARLPNLQHTHTLAVNGTFDVRRGHLVDPTATVLDGEAVPGIGAVPVAAAVAVGIAAVGSAGRRKRPPRHVHNT